MAIPEMLSEWYPTTTAESFPAPKIGNYSLLLMKDVIEVHNPKELEKGLHKFRILLIRPRTDKVMAVMA